MQNSGGRRWRRIRAASLESGRGIERCGQRWLWLAAESSSGQQPVQPSFVSIGGRQDCSGYWEEGRSSGSSAAAESSSGTEGGRSGILWAGLLLLERDGKWCG